MDIKLSSDFDRFIEEVDRGREGRNELIPVGFPKLDYHIGIGKGMYILAGGESGTGKTALVDEMFVLNPYDWYKQNRAEKGIKLRIIYLSMERSKKHKIAKWVCRKLWLDHNILMDVKTILGRRAGEEKLPEDIYQKILDCNEYFDEMFHTVQIKDGATNPTGMYKLCTGISLKEGTLIKADDKKIKVYRAGNVIQEKEFSGDTFVTNEAGIDILYETIRLKNKDYIITQYEKEYIPDDENVVNILVSDHNGKWKNERNFTDKQTLDKATEYMGELRDIFGWGIVAINQFNRAISDTGRRVHLDLTPEKQDFKGSGDMYEDADFVCAIFNPHENNMQSFKGFKIQPFTSRKGFNRFRSFHILKNTYGGDNMVTGLNFIGECGHFRELPTPKMIQSIDYPRYADPENDPPNPKSEKPVILL